MSSQLWGHVGVIKWIYLAGAENRQRERLEVEEYSWKL